MNRLRAIHLFTVLLLLVLCLPVSGTGKELSELDKCLLEAMKNADAEVTIGELQKQCLKKTTSKTGEKTIDATTAPEKEKKAEKSAVDTRLSVDDENILKPFTLMSHKPNYFLFVSHTTGGINTDPYREAYDDPSIEAEDTEARFQISIKTPLAVNLFNKPIDLFAAYTNRSFWQLYNNDLSSPFRETNHEPEAWAQFRPNWTFAGITNKVNGVGFVHQSNGRGGTLSRSWNRIFASFVFQKQALFTKSDTLAFSIKPWIRISENDEDDDNPDITDFLGHFETRAVYKWKRQVFSLMLRNNIESSFKRGAVEFDWSFPIWNYPYLKGYFQWFSGYGESLIDYNVHNNSIGVGLLITDWL
jgi:phospholipase A1/A2